MKHTSNDTGCLMRFALIALCAIVGCSNSTEPARLDLPRWSRLDASAAATCGVATDGRGYCWGAPWSAGGVRPANAFITVPELLPGAERWAAIETGERIICGLTPDAKTYCWGSGSGRQPVTDTAPRRVSGDPGFASISVGSAHACGLTADGTAYCWGDNFREQLGVGPQPNFIISWSDTPLRVAADVKFRAIRAGPESTCGIVVGGDVYCWGGTEVRGEASTPRPVQRGFGFVNLEYGGSGIGHGDGCAQTAAGSLSCFNYQAFTALTQPTPHAIDVPGGVAPGQFSVNGVWTPGIDLPLDSFLRGDLWHGCALTSSGTAFCWGKNTYGQLGDGTVVDRAGPVAVVQLNGVAQIAAGGAHTCAVTTDGAAYCWGVNNKGQLGIGSIGNPSVIPRLVTMPAQ